MALETRVEPPPTQPWTANSSTAPGVFGVRVVAAEERVALARVDVVRIVLR
jgi:hypothetical protein